MTGICITVEPDDGCEGPHGHHDPQEVVPFEKEKDDLPPKEAGDDNRTKELIAQEERASNDYDQMADEADDPATKKVFEDISNEERVHAGELLILLLKQDPKEKEALEEGSEEVRELVGGESFREMFAKGRKKVENKARGEPDGHEGHFAGKKNMERDIRRADRRLNQGMGHRENPRLGEKRSQSTEEEARRELGRPEPGSQRVKTKTVRGKEITEKTPVPTVHSDPSKVPSVRNNPKGKPDTPSRPGPDHDIGGSNDRMVSMEAKETPNKIFHNQAFAWGDLPGPNPNPGSDKVLTAVINKPELVDYLEAMGGARYEPYHIKAPVSPEAYGSPISTVGNEAPQNFDRLPKKILARVQNKTIMNALQDMGLSFDDEPVDPNADSEGLTGD